MPPLKAAQETLERRSRWTVVVVPFMLAAAESIKELTRRTWLLFTSPRLHLSSSTFYYSTTHTHTHTHTHTRTRTHVLLPHFYFSIPHLLPSHSQHFLLLFSIFLHLLLLYLLVILVFLLLLLLLLQPQSLLFRLCCRVRCILKSRRNVKK